MRAAIRFLWRQYAPASAVFLLYALLMTLFRSCSSAGPAGSPLGTYYYMFPIIPALFLLVFNFGVHSTFLDIALSMGCTRRDFLWGHQLLMVLLTLGLSALTALFLFVPGLLGLPEADFMAPAGLVYLVPFTLATAEAASAGGTLRRTHPRLSLGFYALCLLVLIALAVQVQVAAVPWLWGDLAWILALVSVILGILSLGVCVYGTRRAVVR